MKLTKLLVLKCLVKQAPGFKTHRTEVLRFNLLLRAYCAFGLPFDVVVAVVVFLDLKVPNCHSFKYTSQPCHFFPI